MTLQEAMLTFEKFKRPHWLNNEYYQYFAPETGPHDKLVNCDYFITTSNGFSEFTTSLGLYPDDILATDWIICA